VLLLLDLFEARREAGVSRFRFCTGRAAVTFEGVDSGSAEGIVLVLWLDKMLCLNRGSILSCDGLHKFDVHVSGSLK